MKRSYLVAAAIMCVVTLWMLSGAGEDESAPLNGSVPGTPALVPTRVQVELYQAEPMAREIVVHGSTQARRSVTLRAEVAGRVEQSIGRRGAVVAGGTTLFRLNLDERKEQLIQARALVRQRELEYQASRSLKKQGLKAESQLAESLTLLEAARAQLRNAELNVVRTEIVAPFDGVIQEHYVEHGDYLGVGDPVALILERDPLTIGGELSENEVGQIRPGMAATARLAGGGTLSGQVSYIAPAASTETRSFRVEMEASNPDGLPAGVTASIHIPLEKVNAHKLSPALLSLNDAGVIGVKSVDAEGIVQFHEVELLRSDSEGLWLAGLPAQMSLITIGQGFVRAGDRVEAVTGE